MNVMSWRKYSTPTGDNCVEVGATADGAGVAVRQSREPHGPILTYTWEEWHWFEAGMIKGMFSRASLCGDAV